MSTVWLSLLLVIHMWDLRAEKRTEHPQYPRDHPSHASFGGHCIRRHVSVPNLSPHFTHAAPFRLVCRFFT